MAKDDTKKAMSDAAKEANAMRKLKSAGLGEKELAAMKAKYGARAYDLINAAMFPDNVRRALGWKTFKRSGATIKDFIANPLTPEQIEKVTGKKADNSKSATATRTETKETLKQQRSNADKAKKAAEDKKRAETDKKKVETEKKTAQEKAAQQKAPKETKSKSQEKPVVSDKSTTQVSDTLRCQIEKQNVGDKVVFKSSVTDPQGVTIPELSGATKDSLWDVTYQREVSNEKNPVGGVKTFWGAMQYNTYGARNVAMWALSNPKYKNIAQKFFKPGYEQALAEFQKYVKDKGNNVAYWQENKYRTKLAAYIDPKYKALFEQEGKNNSTQFLQLQRDFASEVFTSQHSVYKRIVKALEKKGMKPEDVNPAIWGMVLSSGIHYKTKLNAIASIFEQPNVDQTYINSAKMVDAIAATDPSTFKKSSGKIATQYAKDHIHEKHSATTSRELAIILHKPEILANYEQLMAQNVVKQADGTYLAKAQQPTKTASNNVRTNNTARM